MVSRTQSTLQIITLLFLITPLAFSAPHHADEWRKRTIYQVLTDRFYPTTYTPGKKDPCPNLRHYCGGTFKGLASKLDYIKGMGFDAIWISPIVKNTEWAFETQGYHGYWMTDLYQVNEHFGTSQDLIDLIQEAHKKEIWVMVDVVGNHGGPIGQNFTKFGAPLNLPEHYHEYCNVLDIDHVENQWRVERCWLAGLADFNHENPFVYKTLVNWIGNMTKYFDIDGLRIDTVCHVPHHFWGDFNVSSNVFQIGEALDKRPKYVASYQKYLEGKFSSFFQKID